MVYDGKGPSSVGGLSFFPNTVYMERKRRKAQGVRRKGLGVRVSSSIQYPGTSNEHLETNHIERKDRWRRGD
jgi:hypothetical protein